MLKKAFVRFAVISTAFWVLLLVASVLFALLRSPVPSQSVLAINLDGEIGEQEAPPLSALFGELTRPSLRELCESVRAAAKDERILGLVLKVQRPKLSAAGLGEIEEAMAVFRASGKWSVGYLDTAGELAPGDGALALASMANEVVLAPTGEVNLVGLEVLVPFFKGTLAKLEVTPFVEKREDYKNAADSFTEAGFTAAHKTALKSLADDLAKVVHGHIAARREVELATVGAWIEEAPLDAATALRLGVVDRLGYFESVVAAAEKAAGREDCLLELATYAPSREIHTRGPKVALILGAGEIHRGQSSPAVGGSPSMGSDTITQAFREARAAKVSGILFRVDSPGGSYIASDLIRREVELCREAKIPVVVSMGGYAASGGYMVTLGADRVLADPGTITGSIGVYAATFATRRFWREFLGVSFDGYRTHPGAMSLSMLDPPDERARAAVAQTLDRIYEDFTGKVAAARKKTVAEVREVARGRIWSGEAALARGLIDELGGLETALDRLKELANLDPADDVSLLELPRQEGPLALLRGLAGGARWLPSVVSRDLEALARRHAAGLEHVLALPSGLEVNY